MMVRILPNRSEASRRSVPLSITVPLEERHPDRCSLEPLVVEAEGALACITAVPDQEIRSIRQEAEVSLELLFLPLTPLRSIHICLEARAEGVVTRFLA